MVENAHETLIAVRSQAKELRAYIPDVFSAYAKLGQAAIKPGALDEKTKELIALAIAVTRECDGCIAAHAESAARVGAQPEEVAEALGVAILLNGGPGTVWGPRAFAAFQQARARQAE